MTVFGQYFQTQEYYDVSWWNSQIPDIVFLVQEYNNNESFLLRNGINYPGQNGLLVQKQEEPEMVRSSHSFQFNRPDESIPP